MNKIYTAMALIFGTVLFALPVRGYKANADEPGKSPTGVCMTYYDEIDSRGFAWQTSTSVEESKLFVVKALSSTPDWTKAEEIDGRYVDFQGYRCHKAQIVDLEAGKYFYRVGGEGVYSDTGSFTVDGDKDDKVSFVYVTDAQETSPEGFEYWNKTLVSATETIEPDFIAFAGDLVDNSHAGWGSDLTKIQMQEWSYAFDVPKDVLMNVPFMSVSGNHERAGSTYVNHSNIDFVSEAATGGYYSFDYNDVHFVGLDSNQAENESVFANQIEWLKSDLESTDKKWKIVMLHIGPYSTGDHSNDSEAVYIRSVLPQIFARYEVDLVLQGHDHVYTRTLPYYYGDGENGRIPNRNILTENDGDFDWSMEPDGTYYITVNFAGTKSYAPVEYDSSRIFPANSPINGKLMSQEIPERMFAGVTIDGDSLLLRSYISKDDGTNDLYDYIAIRKNTYKKAASLIDDLPETVNAKDSLILAETKAETDKLSDRALKRLGEDRTEKLDRLLGTFDLQDGLQAYTAICAIDLLSYDLQEDFTQKYSAAKNAYFSLNETQKELVYNKDKLLRFESVFAEKLYIEKVQQLIDGIDAAADKQEAVLIAREAYGLLSDEAKMMITGAERLVYEEEPQKAGCGSSQFFGCFAVVELFFVACVTMRGRSSHE